VHRQTLEFLGAPIKPLDRGVPFITTPFEPMPAELHAHLEALYDGEPFCAADLRRAVFADAAPDYPRLRSATKVKV
jgi:hypothetical protein